MAHFEILKIDWYAVNSCECDSLDSSTQVWLGDRLTNK